VIFVEIGTVQSVFYLRTLMKFQLIFYCYFGPMQIKFDARNIYKTLIRSFWIS